MVASKSNLFLVFLVSSMLSTHTYFHFVCTTETYKWNQNQREKSNAKTQMLLAWIGSFEVVVLFVVIVVFLQDGILVVAECQVKFHAVFGPDSFQSVWSANKLYHFNGWQRTLKIISICIIFPFQFLSLSDVHNLNNITIYFVVLHLDVALLLCSQFACKQQYTSGDFNSYAKMTDFFLFKW